jgi:hypothetical protein
MLYTKGLTHEAYRAIGKRPFCLWIGVLNKHKGPLDVIEIARRISQMDFVMIGWPHDKPIADRLVAEKPTNVYYLGAVPNDLKRELIEKCSVGLTTSKYEGFGLVPFEFLSAGKPVLAYPLEVFKEVYGDLIIYADSIDEITQRLRQLCSRHPSVTVDASAVAKRKARYDLAKAASRIVRRLDVKSLLVFTQDVSTNRDEIAGYYLLQWRLWKAIKENGTDLHILANGRKFSAEFDLADQTTEVGRVVQHLGRRMETLKQSPNRLHRAEARVVDLVMRTLEPMCYVYRYVTKRRDLPSRVIITSMYSSEIFAAIIVKFIFGLKLAYLFHDATVQRYEWATSSLFMKIYYLAYMRALQHVDLIMLVSNTMRKEFLSYYPYEDKLMVIWDENATQLSSG